MKGLLRNLAMQRSRIRVPFSPAAAASLDEDAYLKGHGT